jgi:hypothetical protein
MKWLVVLFALFAFTASAADISGNWKGTADFGGQTIERTFVFKVEGTKLTGDTTSEFLGKSTIKDGKVEGDTVTFTITGNVQGNEMTMTYKGKVAADGKAIKFTVDAGGQTIVWDAKKVS